MSLTAESRPSRDFFIAGGTLPLQSDSYVERVADAALLDALLRSRFCYVLNSRQMGKSSLCVRTMSRLEEQGIHCAFVDITKIGGRNVTPEQWYAGLAVEIGRAFNLRSEFLEYWKTEGHLSPMQRLFGALHDVALAKLDGKIVIFVDEIDSTRSLPFDTDEFFAGVRECFNRRVQEPAYERLTFCFLGVAVPTDLMHDARTTPFNIGERIYLKDFTYEEVKPLAAMLGENGDKLLRRVFYWTNGHPFLTQSICRALVERGITTEAEVDDLIHRDLLEPKVRETNINLSDVGNRVLNGYADGDDVSKFRADILSAYGKALAGKETLQDDESNRITAVLKLSGLMRSEGKSLKVRNRIYERAFDKTWIKENMPGQELRRQRRAFLLGVIRTAVVAGVVVAIIGALALRINELRKEATAERDRANYEAYVADMNLMPDLWKRGDIQRMRTLLDATAQNRSRGWEWSLWNRMAHLSSQEMSDAAAFALSRDGSQLLVRGTNIIRLVDAKTFSVIKTFPSKGTQYSLDFFPDGKRMMENEGGAGTLIYDLSTGKLVAKVANFYFTSGAFEPHERWALGTDGNDLPVKLDLVRFTTSPIADQQIGVNWRDLSRSAKYSIWSEEYSTAPGKTLGVSIRETNTWKEIARLPVEGSTAVAITPDDTHALVGDRFGSLSYWSIPTAKRLWKIKPYSNLITRLSLTDDAKFVSTIGRERFGKVFEINDKGARLVRTFPDANITMISPSGDRVYFAYWSLRAYDLPGEDAVRTFQFPFTPTGGTMTPDATVFESRPPGVIYRLSIPGDTTPTPFWNGNRPVGGYDDVRGWFWLVSKTGGYDVFDLRTKNLVGSMDVDAKTTYPLGAYPRSPKVLIGSSDNIQTWDLANRNLSLTFEVKDQAIVRATISPDERTLAIGLGSGDVIIKDLQTGLLRRVSPHSAKILSMKFSADGTKLITTADDDAAAVIDVQKAAVVLRLVGHSQSVEGADISSDGHRIATASDDGTVAIWDASTGRELTLLEVGSEAIGVRFLNGGKNLAAGTINGTVKLWATDNSWTQK